MGASEVVLEQYNALINARLQQRDPAWLKQLRENAAERLQQSGLPTRRWESWHYSAADSWLAQFAEKQTLAPITPDLAAGHSQNLPAGHVIHFNHGYLVDQQLQNDEHADLGHERQAFSLLSLAQLDEKDHAALIAWLGALNPVDPLANLAIALSPETWVLIVEANARVKQPIIFSHRNTKTGSQISQLIVWMQTGAEATVVEHFAADSASEYLQHAHTATRLEPNSKLTHVRINRDSDRGQHLGTFDAQLARDAKLQLQVLENGCGTQQHNRIRNGIYVDLAEPNAEFIARGAFAASDMQHVDYHFCVNHNSDRGRSDILMQGLAADASRGIINGRIYIGANTCANDGHFTSHNLLLSATAEINAKPELEIYADEVSCAHGATVGQLDEEQLLYMQTRGIDRDQAVILLTEGFLKAGLLDCSNSNLNEFLQRQMLETLPTAKTGEAENCS